MNILIAGGGTGGHISPGIALYEEFRNNGIRAFFLAGKKDIRFSSLSVIPADDLLLYKAPNFTKNIFKIPFFIFNFIKAVIRTKRIIKKHEITAIIGMGGYVSGPALIAAKQMHVPIYLCEQNSVPGRVTKFFEKYAVRIYGTFEISKDYLQCKDKFFHAGNPIRQNVLTNISRDEAKKAFHLTHCKKIILAIGGSQGALKINELVFGLKEKYPDDFKNIGFIWSTGDYSYETYKEKIHNEVNGGSIYVSPFITKVGLAYRASDVVISRAGAGVMMELAAMGLPTILIPYPFAAMNHQDKNADAFEKAGAAIKIKNDDAVPEKVAPILLDMLNNPRIVTKMSEKALALAKKDASSIIVKDIIGNRVKEEITTESIEEKERAQRG